ncbi:Viral Atype inclusion protein_ putativelike, partial [Caligus rogercresseyi]
MDILSFLFRIKYPEQYLLERIFSHLLEDKWDEDLLELLWGSSTPLSRFKKGTSGSPSSFHYSPSTFHPLKDFFSSPVTTQISKYQRIAEDQKRLLSLIRLELDQEKLETMNLLKERDELSKERLQLKKALTIARQNLLDNEANLQETDDEAAYEELQKRLSEKRDTEKYVNTLEEQLGQSVDQKEELRRTVENQRTKLEERSMSNAELDSKNIQLQVSLNLEKQLNGDLSHKCSELELQVKELQEILDSRRSSSKNKRP